MKLRLTYLGVRMTLMGELSFRREMLQVITNDYKLPFTRLRFCCSQLQYKPMLSHSPAYHTLLNV